MSYRELHYHWQWRLSSSPEQLWPLVSDTRYFNRDTGAGALEKREPEDGIPPRNARRLLRIQAFGRPWEWEEQPYEWVRPYRYATARRYTRGLIDEARVSLQMTPLPEGGTLLRYDLWIRPNTLIGRIGIPLQLRLFSGKIYERVFRAYDARAQNGTIESPAIEPDDSIQFAPGGRERLAAAREDLLANGADPGAVAWLIHYVETADDLSLNRIRPYALADAWDIPRRAVLQTCLMATRAGLLDLSWDLVCPLCRNPKEEASTLNLIKPQVHCDVCNIDYEANFERSVELTFHLNPAVRESAREEFCMAGPQVTPHIVAQQLLQPGARRAITPVLDAGRHRLRALSLRGGAYIMAADDGLTEFTIRAGEQGWDDDEPRVTRHVSLTLINDTDDEQLFILERMAWSDQSVTAAEVTTMQTFRDLFSREALRPGDQIAVGKLAILFTDLRGSTTLYREIGDAPAFGLVMNHFDVLKSAIAAEGGSIVKTIGDAVMGVFPRPDSAIRALLNAQQALAVPTQPGALPLLLKAGIHYGPCIAVTLNERLDYFGSTVNMAARLETFSSGSDVIVSGDVYFDPAVTRMVESSQLDAEPFLTELKGFGASLFELWRVRPSSTPSPELWPLLENRR
jgi:class 3 adenylate cyclase